jgi:hypothetical protein
MSSGPLLQPEHLRDGWPDKVRFSNRCEPYKDDVCGQPRSRLTSELQGQAGLAGTWWTGRCHKVGQLEQRIEFVQFATTPNKAGQNAGQSLLGSGHADHNAPQDGLIFT